MKTLDGWNASGLNADEYLSPGDEVDFPLYMYFLEVTPPFRHEIDGFLMGEPVDQVNGHMTFMCFIKRDGIYRYVGDITEDKFDQLWM